VEEGTVGSSVVNTTLTFAADCLERKVGKGELGTNSVTGVYFGCIKIALEAAH
jgi:hypothetical protein